MKKKVLWLAALVICCSMVATGTLAYFTTRTVVHNVITTGSVKVQLLEEFDGAKPDPDKENTMVKDGVMPGQQIGKQVKVKNLKADAYVRVRVVYSAELADKTRLNHAQVEAEELMSVDYDKENWTYNKADGWYYYNEALKPEEETTNLFETVTFAGENMGNEYQNARISIDIQAQAVQAANNTGSALTAEGWPAN